MELIYADTCRWRGEMVSGAACREFARSRFHHLL